MAKYLENPRHTQDPVKVVFAPVNAVAAGLVGMFIGSVFFGPMMGGLFLLGSVVLATYIDSVLPRGFLIHRLYRKGLWPIRGVPAGKIERFYE